MDKSSGDTNYEITRGVEVMNSSKCLLPAFVLYPKIVKKSLNWQMIKEKGLEIEILTYRDPKS